MSLILSVHKRCKNKNDNAVDRSSDWQAVAKPIDWLLDWVAKGGAWCATHFLDNKKLKANATISNVIAVDFDGHCRLEDFWQAGTAKQWCAATYTSCSHTEDSPRFRAIFPLALQLRDGAQHAAVYSALVDRLLAELQSNFISAEPFDHGGREVDRMWYGNDQTVIQTNDAYRPVDDWFINGVDVTPDVTTSAGGPIEAAGADDIARAIWGLSVLPPSEDDEYQSVYWPITKACALIGDDVHDAWLEWVDRGHHAAKPVNRKSSVKWKTITPDGSVAKLFYYFNQFMPDWKQRLPAQLKFTAPKATVGETPDFEAPAPSNSQTALGGSKKASKKSGRLTMGDALGIIAEAFPTIRFNVMTRYIEVIDANGQLTVMDGDKLNLAYVHIYNRTGTELNKTVAADLLSNLADQNHFNPITAYLESCAALEPHPQWTKLGRWLLGNDSNQANTALQRVLVGAVARAYNPGCSMSWIPILVGKQGAGKSQLIKSLVPREFMAEITAPLEKLVAEPSLLHRGWLLELGEIDHLFNPKDIETFKNLISTATDEVRLPYARQPSRMPRRFVMVGTTNRSQFLVDPTGNRRFVPLEIPQSHAVPWRQVAAERDQLWSAAMAAYKDAMAHEYQSGEIAVMHDYIQQFNDDDVWTDDIVSFLRTVDETTTRDVLKGALGADIQKIGRKESIRANNILTHLGWRRQQTTRNGKSVRIWVRPEGDPGSDSAHIKEDF